MVTVKLGLLSLYHTGIQCVWAVYRLNLGIRVHFSKNRASSSKVSNFGKIPSKTSGSDLSKGGTLCLVFKLEFAGITREPFVHRGILRSRGFRRNRSQNQESVQTLYHTGVQRVLRFPQKVCKFSFKVGIPRWYRVRRFCRKQIKHVSRAKSDVLWFYVYRKGDTQHH